jgi:hypothetical protein
MEDCPVAVHRSAEAHKFEVERCAARFSYRHLLLNL